MRLIQFREPGPPHVLQCLDVPIPEPKPDEVLIRAHAIGVGIPDLLIRAGTYSWMPPLPATPGTELSGTITKVGRDVRSRKPGQRVYTSARERPHRGGHYAEYVATPAEATFVLPDSVDLDAAAALANYQVAYHIFNDAVRPRPGQSVLIYAAAGGMGNALIDLAKAAGLTVIGVVSSDEKARFARDLGADHTINRKREMIGERVSENHPRQRGRHHHRSGRRTQHSRKHRDARAMRHPHPLWSAWRKGAARLAANTALEQELAGGPAILDPYLGQSRRGETCWNAQRHRNARCRQAASAHPCEAAARRSEASA
jgi:D-arabinose 1-dehydrogenase-like Zn-dependent alcohol dehydrogenase